MPYYMKIDGVTGGANYLGTDVWSTVDSMSFGLHSDVTVQRKLDFVSPRLTELALTGKHLPQVLIDFVGQAAGGDVLVERITLRPAVVASASIISSTHQQSLQFVYDKITKVFHDLPQPGNTRPTSTVSAVSRSPTRQTF